MPFAGVHSIPETVLKEDMEAALIPVEEEITF